MTPLEDLLQQCTVKITVPGGWGTGFFVAPGLILTCAHVIRKAADLQVTIFYPAWQQPLSAIVKAKADDGKTLDLALVELAEPLSGHPCVLLDDEPVAIGQALYSYGYLESYANAAPVHPVNEGLTGDTPPLLKLQGAQIEKGISGAALLNLKTSKVCGMVKETRAAGFDLGGGAIPTHVILEQFPELRSLQQAFHGGDRRWRDRTGAIDFQPYREAVIYYYSKQRHLYTPTDALLFLEARSVERQVQDDRQKQQSEKTVEQFPVLEGLRKYAFGNQREHVLLAGRPGSGKSTTLRQLAVSLAEEGQVPVLVQLKGDRPVLEAIASELEKGNLYDLEPKEIKRFLRQQRFVLLLDGVNEIPNDSLRRSLIQFRQDNLTVPMIFTTRDLSLGGDLGIDKRLEMKSLSEQQMREFVGKYLPEQGERLLGQLRDRLRELAETPLLLKLLCDVFDPETNQIPQNRGELFRQFDRDYKRIKKEIEYVPVSENFWEFKSEMLQYLAFRMIQGDLQTADLQKPPEPWLTIHKSRAAGILETWLHQRGVVDAPTKAKKWLQDLCNHHFLQDAAKPEEIEFHHQLFQEYYTAEYLSKLLPTLTDEQLKRDYLNYLKWTESISLTLALLNDESAIRFVKFAFEVDPMLGARLAGEVKIEFQAETVKLVDHLTVPSLIRLPVYQIKRSRKLPRWLRTVILKRIKSVAAATELLKTLDIEDRWIDKITKWIKKNWELISEIIPMHGNSEARIEAVLALGGFATNSVYLELVGLLKNLDIDVDTRAAVAVAIGETGNQAAIPELIIALQDNNAGVRMSASWALGELGYQELIPELFLALKSNDDSERGIAITCLGLLRQKQGIPALLSALEDNNYKKQRITLVEALGRIGCEEIIPELLNTLRDEDPKMRLYTLDAIRRINCEGLASEVIEALEYTLRCDNMMLRREAARVLGVFRCKEAIPALLHAFRSDADFVPGGALWALGEIGDDSVVPEILEIYRCIDPFQQMLCTVRFAELLGKLGGEEIIPELIKILRDKSLSPAHVDAAQALGRISPTEASKYLPYLQTFLPTGVGKSVCEAIASIQNRCQFYNYEIWQAHLAAQKADRPKSQNSDRPSTIYEVNAEVVQIVENNYGTIHGKQTP